MRSLAWRTFFGESELSFTQRKYVEVFRRACASLLTLVNDILDLSKIESGRFELEHIQFDLLDLLRAAIDMIQPRESSRKIYSWKSNVASDTPSALLRGSDQANPNLGQSARQCRQIH